MNSPPWFNVRLGDAVQASLSNTFDVERSSSGKPSISDAKDLWWPEVEVATKNGWSSGARVYDDQAVDVRLIAIRAFTFFPPCGVVVARTSTDDSLVVDLVVIGVDFDWDLWEAMRIDGLND